MSERRSRYGCVKCQKHHYSGDPEYQGHLLRQSKHGIENLTEKQYQEEIAVRLMANSGKLFEEAR